MDNAEDMSSYSELGLQGMQAFSQYFGDQPFTSGPVYVGALIFVLFIIGVFVVKGPVKWALLVATIFSILLSWGHNFMGLTDWFIDNFPMYNKFRTVSSILVIAEFTMPLLAVLALREMFIQEDFFKKHGKLTYIVFGCCAALCVMFAFMPEMFGGSPSDEEAARLNQALGGQATLDQLPGVTAAVEAIRHSLVSSDAWRSLVIIALGFITLLAYKFEKLNAMATSLIVASIVLVDMFMVNKRYLNEERFVSRDDLPETTFEKTAADTQILADTTQNYRVLDLQGFTQPRSSYFHKTIGGYHAAKLTRYNDLIERQITKNNMNIVNMLNGKWVIINNEQAQQNPGALGNAWFVDSLTYVKTADEEMKFLDKFNPATSAVADAKFKDVLKTAKPKQPGDTIFETTYAPNKLTYHAHSEQGGLAVFSEIYFPWGWTATIDGKKAEIGRVNYVLRAMQLPAGDHTIVMTYDPEEVHKTEGIAKTSVYAILLLIVVSLGWGIYKSTRRKEETETRDN
ncbi:MAG: YfhO family protein [Muribaculaceae bacterium]|nr:YfhO family protein [Muribaculaceae bacterium]